MPIAVAIQAAAKGFTTRPKIFENSEHRLQFREHDLRTTFVTLSLALGKTDEWVILRTGHADSKQLRVYRVGVTNAQAHGLQWLKPLHEAIPELAALAPTNPNERPEGDSQAQAGSNNWTPCQSASNTPKDE